MKLPSLLEMDREIEQVGHHLSQPTVSPSRKYYASYNSKSLETTAVRDAQALKIKRLLNASSDNMNGRLGNMPQWADHDY